MQCENGSMVGLSKEQFDKFLKGGNKNIVSVGDVFKVNGCCFEVENISDYGISARGISKHEYNIGIERQLHAELTSKE